MKSAEIAVIAGAVGLFAFVVYKSGRAIASGVSTVATAVNPANPENIVNKGVQAVGAAATGDQHFTLGGWLYDVTHPPAFAETSPVTSRGVSTPQFYSPSMIDANMSKADAMAMAVQVDALGNPLGAAP